MYFKGRYGQNQGQKLTTMNRLWTKCRILQDKMDKILDKFARPWTDFGHGSCI